MININWKIILRIIVFLITLPTRRYSISLCLIANCHYAWLNDDCCKRTNCNQSYVCVNNADHVHSRQSSFDWYPQSIASINPWLILDQHFTNTLVKTIDITVDSLPIFDRFIWVRQHLAYYWLTIDQVLMECQTSIDRDVNWGCQSRVLINTRLQINK